MCLARCSPSDYHFTAPVRGLYWFTLSIVVITKATVELTLNGQSMVVANDNVDYGGDAVSVILMLEVGDRVSCRKTTSSYNLYELGSASHNTFSGFLYVEL